MAPCSRRFSRLPDNEETCHRQLTISRASIRGGMPAIDVDHIDRSAAEASIRRGHWQDTDAEAAGVQSAPVCRVAGNDRPANQNPAVSKATAIGPRRMHTPLRCTEQRITRRCRRTTAFS